MKAMFNSVYLDGKDFDYFLKFPEHRHQHLFLVFPRLVEREHFTFTGRIAYRKYDINDTLCVLFEVKIVSTEDPNVSLVAFIDCDHLDIIPEYQEIIVECDRA